MDARIDVIPGTVTTHEVPLARAMGAFAKGAKAGLLAKPKNKTSPPPPPPLQALKVYRLTPRCPEQVPWQERGDTLSPERVRS